MVRSTLGNNARSMDLEILTTLPEDLIIKILEKNNIQPLDLGVSGYFFERKTPERALKITALNSDTSFASVSLWGVLYDIAMHETMFHTALEEVKDGIQ